MRVTIKNLQQQTFIVDIEANKTVFNLKEEIEKLKGCDYQIERQKLIYAGVILEDDKELTSYNIDEKKFVVVMVKREVGNLNVKSDKTSPTVQSDIKDEKSKEEEPKEPAKVEVKSAEDVKTTKETEISASAQTSSTTTPVDNQPSSSIDYRTQAESHLSVGQEYADTVNSIVEMGYSRDMVERAMMASFNNPERAVEYLISGIPETEGGLEPNIIPESNSPSNTVAAEPSAAPTSANAENPFDFLQNQPQFLQMRSLINQNPDLLNAVLQQIGQTNPGLLQLIHENQDAFLNMINQPIDNQGSSNPITSSMLPGIMDMISGRNNEGRERSANREENPPTSAAANPGTEGSSAQRNETATIRLSTQDQEAIERLKALGFPESLVIQAYFACDKNEQLAANFLLSSSFDD